MRPSHKLLPTFALVASLLACGNTDRAISSTTVVVTASDRDFTPSQFTVAAGRKLTVVLINTGQAVHTIAFDLPDGPVQMTPSIAAGKTGQAELDVPSREGVYEFYCPLDGHRATGMQGAMIVGLAATATGW